MLCGILSWTHTKARVAESGSSLSVSVQKRIVSYSKRGVKMLIFVKNGLRKSKGDDTNVNCSLGEGGSIFFYLESHRKRISHALHLSKISVIFIPLSVMTNMEGVACAQSAGLRC